MSESKQRQYHSPELKAKVGLEAIRGTKTINEIGLEYSVHPAWVTKYRYKVLTGEVADRVRALVGRSRYRGETPLSKLIK